jgi:hypothetical protein
MDRSAFARDVAALAAGKRMPEGVYVHVATLPSLPAELARRGLVVRGFRLERRSAPAA